MKELGRFVKIEKAREVYKRQGAWSLVRQGDMLLRRTLERSQSGH